jgi:AcrR family transcriptional regulator
MAAGPTRQLIVEAADQLFYQRGFEHTSFADIADALRISRGNFYYHFQTKDEILMAVIEARLANTRKMLEQWEADGERPIDRIRSFIRLWLLNSEDIQRYGCPVGTLCAELSKLGHASQKEARELFILFRGWLREQFIQLGRDQDADELAMQLLARSQGAAMLANAFHDTAFIEREVDQMCEWVIAVTQGRGRNPKQRP